MKRKKLLASILALAMTLALVTLPAGAVTFPDIQTHWGKLYIEEMTDAGLFIGYEDGTFKPEEQLSTSMALALCARIAANETLRKQIGSDRHKEIEALTGTKWLSAGKWEGGLHKWFSDEFATCLELGILDYNELENLIDSDAISKPMEKAEFSRYLVRAMGLESVAASLEISNLTFADADDVQDSLRPYVYLLSLHGVVIGDLDNRFLPESSVTRAVTATMLSRAMAKMTELQINVELPRYTTYSWSAGYIQDVEPGDEGSTLLTLKSELTGIKSITIPNAALVYQDNRRVERTALKEGSFARVCYDDKGVPASVRVIAADRLNTTSGVLSNLSDEKINVGGKSYAINRFTEVEAGGKTGDRTIIDYEAGYDTATAVTDALGNVVTLQLHGGLRDVYGILASVDTGLSGQVTIGVSAYDGSIQRLVVPADAEITATGGVPAELANGYIGRHITLRVENESITAVKAIEIDSVNKYVQGVLRGVNTKTSPATVILADPATNKQTTYQMATDHVATYNNATSSLGALANGSYVTAKVEGGMVVTLSAWPGAAYTQGVLTRINYGEPTVLEVTRADGVVIPFEISTASLGNVDIVRGGKTSAITKLVTGDTVTVTVQYNTVSRIEAEAKSANISGTIQAITFNAAGAELTLLLPDGTTATYTAPTGVSVTQGGSIIQLSNVKWGAKVELVTSGDQITSMEVTQAGTSTTKLECTVYLVSSRTEITVLISDGLGGSTPVVVNIPTGVSVSDTVNGGTISASKLAPKDRLEIWGNYNKDVFTATTVVKVG